MMSDIVTKDAFEIRPFRAGDEPALMKAWEEAYPDLFCYKYPDRWRWNMFENPFVNAEKRPLCWVAKKGDEVAAWTCAMAVPIDAGGHRVLGGHSVDTFTLERYRRYGLGKKLQKLNHDAHTIFSSIDLSPSNRRNKYNLGGYPGKALDTWLRVGTTLDGDALYDSFLRLVGKYLGRTEVFFSKFRNLGAANFLNFACSQLLRSRKKVSCKEDSQFDNLSFEKVDKFDVNVDILWEKISKNYSFAIARNAVYLNWKYVHQPMLDYRKILVLRQGEAVGVLIYRLPFKDEQRIGIIAECFCVDDDWQLYSMLVSHAISDFERNGIDLIKCGASTDDQRKALKTLGFDLVKIDVPVIHISPEEPSLDLKEIMAKDWMLSLGDQDIDQIRPVQQPNFVDIVRIVRGKVPGSEHLPK